MSDELELHGEVSVIEDGQGLLFLGDPAGIERWLAAQGIESRDYAPNLQRVTRAAGKAARVGADLAGNSGRWVKLTKESAAFVAKNSKGALTSGVVRGEGGRILKHVRFEQASALLSPAVLGGVGGLMAQMALEQSLDQIQDYLATIDKKINDLLQDQKDRAISDLVAIGHLIDEAFAIRDEVGHVSETTWSKLTDSQRIALQAQKYALLKVEGLARKLEEANSADDLEDATRTTNQDLGIWLAVLAQAVQVQDKLAVVEIERAIVENALTVEAHRRGIMGARQRRLDEIEVNLVKLGDRVEAAAARSVTKKLHHPIAAERITRELQATAQMIASFATHLELDPSLEELAKPQRWRVVAGEAKDSAMQATTETMSKAAGTLQRFGKRALKRATDAKDKALQAEIPSMSSADAASQQPEEGDTQDG